MESGFGGLGERRKIKVEKERVGVIKSIDFGRTQPELYCLLCCSAHLIWAHPINLLSSGILLSTYILGTFIVSFSYDYYEI